MASNGSPWSKQVNMSLMKSVAADHASKVHGMHIVSMPRHQHLNGGVCAVQPLLYNSFAGV